MAESGLCDYEVIQIDSVSIKAPESFSGILISPGPGIPSDTPVLKEIIRFFEKDKSILGVCLGHQAITDAYGGALHNMNEVYHGYKEEICVTDKSDYLFSEVPDVFYGGLYHSWEADKKSLPDELKITAMSRHEVIMALSHRHFDVKGVQFHPESYMTEFGKQIILNWLNHLLNKNKNKTI